MPGRIRVGQLFPAEQTQIVKLLVEKVIVSPERSGGTTARQRHRTTGAGTAASRRRRDALGGNGMNEVRIHKTGAPDVIESSTAG